MVKNQTCLNFSFFRYFLLDSLTFSRFFFRYFLLALINLSRFSSRYFFSAFLTFSRFFFRYFLPAFLLDSLAFSGFSFRHFLPASLAFSESLYGNKKRKGQEVQKYECFISLPKTPFIITKVSRDNQGRLQKLLTYNTSNQAQK